LKRRERREHRGKQRRQREKGRVRKTQGPTGIELPAGRGGCRNAEADLSMLFFSAFLCVLCVLCVSKRRPPVTLNELTSAIIGAAIKVHRTLGPGLLESVYRKCLAYELRKLELHVDEEKPIPVVYEEVKLECGFRADLLVEGKVVVECKAKEKVHPVERAQLLSHLRLMDLQVGLLINFHELVLKDGIQRIVNNYREE
jgi:GxxExxY protein